MAYVAVWPVLDRDRPTGALIAEASRGLDIMVQLAGGKIAGEPLWYRTEDRLVCLTPARTVGPQSDEPEPVHRITGEQRELIHRLALQGMTARRIASAASVSPTTAARYAKEVR
jgi:hypothetical protein